MRRPCLDCRQLFDVPKAKRSVSRCPTCQKAHGRGQNAQRDRRMRAFYRSSDWIECRAVVLERDGHRCRALERDGTRCAATTSLQVHHTTLAIDLDDDQLADPRWCATLCHRHHGMADGELRRERRGG